MPTPPKKESKKDQTYALYDQGLRPADQAVKDICPAPKTRYNYFGLWRKDRGADGGSPVTTGGQSPPEAKSGTQGAPMVVGKITITPENWGMDQKGAILIIDTYNKAKRDIGYGGTIGEFICDVTMFFRRIYGYEEVDYGQPQATPGEGGSGGEENGGKNPGTGFPGIRGRPPGQSVPGEGTASS